MAGVSVTLDPGLLAEGESLVEKRKQIASDFTLAKRTQWIETCRINFALGKLAQEKIAPKKASRGSQPGRRPGPGRGNKTIGATAPIVSEPTDEEKLTAYAHAWGLKADTLQEYRDTYVFHLPESDAIADGQQDPKASFTVYRDAVNLKDERNRSIGKQALAKAAAMVAAGDAKTLDSRLLRATANKEPIDRSGFGKRTIRTKDEKIKRKADEVEAHLAEKEVRAEIQSRSEERDKETRNERAAKRLAEQFERAAQSKVRDGDRVAAKGPIQNPGDLIKRLKAAAVMVSGITLNPKMAGGGVEKKSVIHELRQLHKFSGLAVEALTGELPVLDSETVTEMLELIAAPSSDNNGGKKVTGAVVTDADDDDEVEEGEVIE